MEYDDYKDACEELESLRSIREYLASMGRTGDELVRALNEARDGDLTRLREFGIK